MVITLIGYRGCGKTSVAEPLAQRLGWQSVDADAEIERRAGRSIRQLFDAGGEVLFRRHERDVMAELLTRDRVVIAAGGGAVLDEETRHEMREAGPVVWLRADVETLAQRIRGDGSTKKRRPNLTSTGGIAEIEELLKQREPIYRACADVTLATDNLSVEQLVDQIMSAVGSQIERGA